MMIIKNSIPSIHMLSNNSDLSLKKPVNLPKDKENNVKNNKKNNSNKTASLFSTNFTINRRIFWLKKLKNLIEIKNKKKKIKSKKKN